MALMSRSFCRAVVRNTSQRPALCSFSNTAFRPPLPSRASHPSYSARLFSAMASLKSAAADPALPKAFDPEIVEMANYVHNKAITSDLAVRDLAYPRTSSP